MKLELQALDLLKTAYQHFLGDVRAIVREEIERQSIGKGEDLVLNQKDMAEYLGISPVTLRKYEAQGLPSIRSFGRDPRYRVKEVLDYFEKKKSESYKSHRHG